MPLLDFQCLDCGYKFDELVNSLNRHKIACPKCSGVKIKQIFEGKCLFGKIGGASGDGGCSGKSCSCCSGCH